MYEIQCNIFHVTRKIVGVLNYRNHMLPPAGQDSHSLGFYASLIFVTYQPKVSFYHWFTKL